MKLSLSFRPSPPPSTMITSKYPSLRFQHTAIITTLASSPSPSNVKLGRRWKEYQGSHHWEGLLDPLDHTLRSEILRYGRFVDAAYKSFDFDPSSLTYATSKFPKSALLTRSGLSDTGYRLTSHLHATSAVHLPPWTTQNFPPWLGVQTSSIGYVAICQDKDEIARLGRRDVVIAYRGTATCLEWFENFRTSLAHFPNGKGMVQKGFLNLYTSGPVSLQKMVRQEIARLLARYSDEPLSLTVTGHSLGAALAVLTAYDIRTAFKRTPLTVTAISFGGPRVGNRNFRRSLDKEGVKVLRIVNEGDIVTKVPGLVVNDDIAAHVARKLPRWAQRRMEGMRWTYSEVGKELRLRSRDPPGGMAACHELNTYLNLVDGFGGSHESLSYQRASTTTTPA